MSSSRIEESLVLSEWMGKKMERCEGIADGRTELALTCFYVVWQHHAAIAMNLDRGLVAPATALFRPLYETFIRGNWLHRGASPDELVAFRGGDRPPSLGIMVGKLQEVDQHERDTFSRWHEAWFDELCDLTHTGIRQIRQHWQSSGDVSAQLPPKKERGLLRNADFFALWSLSNAAVIATNNEVAQEALSKMHELGRTT